MLDIVRNGFRNAQLVFQGKTTLTEQNLDEAMRAIRTSLLEADVEFKVVKNFVAKVKEKTLGAVVNLSVTHEGKKLKVRPGDHFIKVCQDELVALMGPADPELRFSTAGNATIMMVGLQGSGKTTTAAKLAAYFQKREKKPLLVAADVYRPAAIEQLKVLGKRLGVPVYHEPGQDPVTICRNARTHAQNERLDVVILDTAGRLALDEQLMRELEAISSATRPENILLVCDAMIGQDAVRTAAEFDRRLSLSGFVITKLDGDTRGGAALSIKEVTGKPIKFLGMGEGLDRLEEFRPEGLASRILGFGDVVGLVKDLESVVDEKKAESDTLRMLQGKFTLEDFIEQIRMIKKMGSLSDLFEKLPFFGNLPPGLQLDDKELVKVEAMIQSMTKKERHRPDLINPSRTQRIARGSGRTVQEVRELLVKYFQMRKLMGKMLEGGGMLDRLPGFKQMRQLKAMGGLDMGDFQQDLAEAKQLIRQNQAKPQLGANEKRMQRNKRKASRKKGR